MSLEEKERQELIKYRIERAKTSVDDVKFLIENDKLILAVNRIYYGVFYILNALALKYKFSTSKHTQLLGWFNKNFVKAGIIEKADGKFVHLAFDKRSKGDYSDFVEFDKNEVNEMYIKMEKFITKITNLINRSIE
ncbi:MAG: HEPN domain-containing protein [Candidatus Cloacimonadota bacterium]|nr:HEPN domain-containing protein [Candidatus Cloacimonadota bacterium]